MKQATTGNKDIIKKLLTDSLSPEEREKLNNYKFVNQAIYSQWEQASDMYTDVDKEERMLTNVMHQIKKGKTGRFRQNLHRYGWVASIALLLICGTLSLMLLSRKAEPEVWYVLNSGRQSMDSVRLADGTLVMLNAGSRLTYPKEFSGNKREVTLSGQAFFSVHPDKAHPFVVKTKNMDVTALGTAFEVFSFDGDESVETVLLNGKVKVEPKDHKEQIKGEYILQPNEKLTCQVNGDIRIDRVDANSYSAWRIGGRLSFKNETLAMILPRLEKWYGQKIDCPQKTADHYRFTFTLRNELLDLILNIMSHSAPLNYKLISNDYYVLEELK
jgi:hypothetical protein